MFLQVPLGAVIADSGSGGGGGGMGEGAAVEAGEAAFAVQALSFAPLELAVRGPKPPIRDTCRRCHPADRRPISAVWTMQGPMGPGRGCCSLRWAAAAAGGGQHLLVGTPTGMWSHPPCLSRLKHLIKLQGGAIK